MDVSRHGGSSHSRLRASGLRFRALGAKQSEYEKGKHYEEKGLGITSQI